MSRVVPRPRIATIVEGHGEVEAVPILLHRIAAEVGPAVWPEILRPYRVARDCLLRPRGLENVVDDLIRRLGGITGLLVVFDADDDCPAAVGPELTSRLIATRPGLPAAVVLPNREFEAWFMAAAPSLAGHQGLADGLVTPANPEAIRGCKEWLSDRRPSGMPYKPRQHQPGLAATVDLAMARDNSPSFAKFHRDVVRLLTCHSLG